MAMGLNELLEGWVDDAPATRLTGIGLDNRETQPGDAFVAVKGQLAHGLDFARAAVASYRLSGLTIWAISSESWRHAFTLLRQSK